MTWDFDLARWEDDGGLPECLRRDANNRAPWMDRTDVWTQLPEQFRPPSPSDAKFPWEADARQQPK